MELPRVGGLVSDIGCKAFPSVVLLQTFYDVRYLTSQQANGSRALWEKDRIWGQPLWVCIWAMLWTSSMMGQN